VIEKGSLKGNLVRLALRGVAIVLGILIALDVLGILATAGAVVGALGVIGIVLGLVFKDWVSIYLPGMMLGLHPPFKVGDFIRIGEYVGRVARLTPSSTVLVTLDAEEVRIPNAEFFRSVLTNFSRHRKRRLRVPLSLALRADLGKAAELGCKAMLRVRGVQADPPPFMRVIRQQGEYVHVEFFAWMDQDEASFLNVEASAVRTVLETLIAASIPLPTMTVTIRRPQHEQGAEVVSGADPSAGTSDAESLDQAFVDEEFTRTRTSDDNEADLLPRASKPSATSMRSHHAR
jgi:small-conductance mechanosensitive channel